MGFPIDVEKLGNFFFVTFYVNEIPIFEHDQRVTYLRTIPNFSHDVL